MGDLATKAPADPAVLWLHIKKAAGQSVRRVLGELYTETNRKDPKPFIALPRAEWNDALNNYRLPLGEYDFRRGLSACDILFGPEGFARMLKSAVVHNLYDRAVSCFTYCTAGHGAWPAARAVAPRTAFHHFLRRLPDK